MVCWKILLLLFVFLSRRRIDTSLIKMGRLGVPILRVCMGTESDILLKVAAMMNEFKWIFKLLVEDLDLVLYGSVSFLEIPFIF